MVGFSFIPIFLMERGEGMEDKISPSRLEYEEMNRILNDAYVPLAEEDWRNAVIPMPQAFFGGNRLFDPGAGEIPPNRLRQRVRVPGQRVRVGGIRPPGGGER
jgi:hypothetical protein